MAGQSQTALAIHTNSLQEHFLVALFSLLQIVFSPKTFIFFLFVVDITMWSSSFADLAKKAQEMQEQAASSLAVSDMSFEALLCVSLVGFFSCLFFCLLLGFRIHPHSLPWEVLVDYSIWISYKKRETHSRQQHHSQHPNQPLLDQGLHLGKQQLSHKTPAIFSETLAAVCLVK
jgi:hypothetical protein